MTPVPRCPHQMAQSVSMTVLVLLAAVGGALGEASECVHPPTPENKHLFGVGFFLFSADRPGSAHGRYCAVDTASAFCDGRVYGRSWKDLNLLRSLQEACDTNDTYVRALADVQDSGQDYFNYCYNTLQVVD